MGSSTPTVGRRAVGGAVVVLAAAAVGAAWHWLGEGGVLGDVRSSGVVRVGYAVEAPYAFLAADGRVTGQSPETARLVAARLGWRIDWVQTDFDSLIPDLLDERFDIAAAGLFVTPERARVVRFARPELEVGGGLLVARGNPQGLRTLADLGRTGVKVAALAGSVEAQQLGAPGSHVVLVPDASSGVAAVQTGLAAALALSWPTVRRMAADQPLLEAVRDTAPAATFLVAPALRPQDAALAAAWSAAQADVLGSEAHLRAIAPFGFAVADLPRPNPAGRRP